MVDPLFGPRHLDDPRNEYVAWIDLMGTGAIMEWSEDIASTNIGKLQIIMAECAESYEIELYPMMDGCYAVSNDEDEILEYAGRVFRRTAKIMLNRYYEESEPDVHFSPVVRGGIAKGNVYHGYDIDGTDLDEHPVQDSILIGQAVARAHACEGDAAPFGCVVHPTAWEKDHPGSLKWWHDNRYAERIVEALDAYFHYYLENSNVEYRGAKIREHRDMAAGNLLRDRN